MKLFGILFSCVCLQMASGPVSRTIYQDPVVQRDPEGNPSAALSFAEQQDVAEVLGSPRNFAPSIAPEHPDSVPASLIGPKDFIIRTGLSPPLVLG